MHIRKYSGALLLVVLMYGSFAKGGLLTSDTAAYNDGTTTWRGTQPFAFSALHANVDYAVYAPGQFHLSSALQNPTDPSGGSKYVYAYQILNDVGGTLPITAFSVGFSDAGDSDAGTESPNKQPASIGYLSPYPPGLAPSNAAFNGTPAQNAVWNYAGALSSGSESAVLIYTSPFPPETDYASVQGLVSDQERLPSPVPEPAAGLVLFVVLAGLSVRRVWRERARCE